MGHRITEVWAWVTVNDDEDSNEGIVGIHTPSGWLPLIGSDEIRLRELRPVVEEIAREHSHPLQLRKFSVMSIEETL